MDCSCRTAALRIFVKSIAQIHVPLRTAAPLRTQYQARHLYTQPGGFYNQRKASVVAAASRTLHTSCARNGAAEAVQAVDEDVRGANKHEDAGSIETDDGVSPNRLSTTESRSRTNRTSSGRREQKKAGRAEPDTLDKKEKKAKKERRGFNPKPVNEDHLYPPRQPRQREPWMTQKNALKNKFPEGWNPRKKLSPDALVGIRMLHQQFPEEYTTEVLAQKFEVSAEAIRRILKSKWTPDAEEEVERQERWFNRGKSVWTHWAALGKKPPRKWRAEGVVRDPVWNKPRGPNHKNKAERAEAQRRLAKGLLG